MTRPAARHALLWAALAAVLLAGATPSRPEARRRAVLISFDGVAGQRLEQLLADPGKLSAGGYRRIAARGFRAGRSVPPTPALTAVSHITIATGARPQATGVVSNTMLDRSKPFGATVSGFDAPIRAETLWEAARRQGLRVGVIYFVGADGKAPGRTADWALTWPGPPLAKGKLHRLAAAAWQAAGGSAEKSFSPARRVSLPFGTTAHGVTVTAIDGTDDGVVNYDHLLVEPESGAASDVGVGEWFPVEVKAAQGRTGAWCRVLSLAPDLSKVELYLGPLHRSTGYPAEFVREMDRALGFWPGYEDAATFGPESEHPELMIEQLDRMADFSTRAQLAAVGRGDWDLLLLYQSEVDSLSHEFWLTDPGQPGFSFERAALFRGFVDRAYEIADRSLDAIERALSPDDAIFVTSDHGMTPVWSEIFPNDLLRRAGFLKLDAGKRLDPSSQAVAVLETGIAHIYLSPGADRSALDRIEAVLRDFRVRGESPFEQIVRRDQAGSLGLDAPESGDLVVLARPGFRMKAQPEAAQPVVPAGEPGAHGYAGWHPELHASFLAAGPGIAHEFVATINSCQIAARVAASLGIDPPRGASR